MTLKVTVLDVEEGTTKEVTLPAGEFIVLAVAPCYVADVQAYPLKGTQVVTVKGHVLRGKPVVDEHKEG